MPDVIVDRRRSARFPLVVMAEVTVLSTGTKHTARTSDVSRTGCYLDTLNPAPKGAQIRVRLIQRNQSFEAQATVMYVSKGLGMGVHFQEDLPEAQLAILDAWLGETSRKP